MEKQKKGDKKTGKPTSTGFGIAGFVLGIASIFLSVWGIIPAILGIIFCIIQFRRGKTGLAIAGLIISIASVIFAILALLFIVAVWQAVGDTVQSQSAQIEQMSEGIGALP